MSNPPKSFDAVATVRQVRDRIGARIAGMTLAEQLSWMAAQDLGDPFLERLRSQSAERRPAQGSAPGRG